MVLKITDIWGGAALVLFTDRRLTLALPRPHPLLRTNPPFPIVDILWAIRMALFGKAAQ